MSFRMSVAVAIFLVLGASAAASKDHNITKVSTADKVACMPDALKLCRDAVPNVNRVLACFGKNRDKLSEGCRAVLVSYGL
jgi:hypothetical protein